MCIWFVLMLSLRAALTSVYKVNWVIAFIPYFCFTEPGNDVEFYNGRRSSSSSTPKAAKKKAAAKPKKPAAHPKYSEMIQQAVTSLKERGGSSRQAILKYVLPTSNAEMKRQQQSLENGTQSWCEEWRTEAVQGNWCLWLIQTRREEEGGSQAKESHQAKGCQAKEGKVSKKAKKPAAKKPAAKKPAAKKAAKPKKAKTPKKAAAKPKKAAKSPKKAKAAAKPKKAKTPKKKAAAKK